MTDIRLYNTLTRKTDVFTPTDPERITLYACGPTVWSYAHIGNGRAAVVFDQLFRVLREVYGPAAVIYARNITDVDDKINKAAHDEGVPIDVITEKYARIYREDMASLGVLKPTLEPTATGHINEIIGLVQTLVDGGHAYVADDGVYFHVPTMPDYGALSGRKLEDLQAGARVEVDEAKRHVADFALWKFAKPNEPKWEAPWGAGRPGWHIECSAMIESVLGETIDIHGGGHDLIFPHHENEIAQSTCAHGGAPLARYWMHNGFLTMDSEKMSKSLGNVSLVHDLLQDWPGEVLRHALLSAHYRAPLDWNEALLQQSKTTLDRWYRALDGADLAGIEPTVPASVIAAMADDLNTPKAYAEIAELVRRVNRAESQHDKQIARAELLGAGQFLGLLQQDPGVWLGQSGEGTAQDSEIESLIAARNDARAARDWAKADALRDELVARGIELTDTSEGTTWRRVA